MIPVDLVQQELTEQLRVGVMLSLECLRQIEQATGIQPLGEHVPGSVADEHLVRNLADNILKISQT